MHKRFMSVRLMLISICLLVMAVHQVQSYSPAGYLDKFESEDIDNTAPVSFAERQSLIRRKRQARRGSGPNKGRNAASLPEHTEGNQILTLSIPLCTDEGILFIQGYENYYVKCVRNQAHGGFHRVIFVCPRDIRAMSDPSICVPPPDCSSCPTNEAGGGGGYDDLGYNGLL